MNFVTFIFATVIGLAALWFSVKFIRLYFQVKKWNRVKTTILSKEIFLHFKVSSSRSPYGLKVTYTYQINNITYTGDKVYLVELAGGQTNHMKKTADAALSKVNQAMEIYVNPTDPTKSVMFCEGVGLYIFVFFMGITSLLIGISNIL
jgi:hypothetical protein